MELIDLQNGHTPWDRRKLINYRLIKEDSPHLKSDYSCHTVYSISSIINAFEKKCEFSL